MIERQFVSQNVKENQIKEFIGESLDRAAYSDSKLIRTPLGEKIVIYTSRPGLIVGKEGQNIKKLTAELKKRFNLENPQIEIAEIENPSLDPQIIAERIVGSLERFGINRFKAIGHKAMEEVMSANALGVEIIMSGKIPSERARSWRFYKGYLKKCGDTALTTVKKAKMQALLKTGIIGVKVSIMVPDAKLPDRIKIGDQIEMIEEVKESTEKKEQKKTKEKGAKKSKK